MRHEVPILTTQPRPKARTGSRPRLLPKACNTCGALPHSCRCLHDIRDPHAFVHATIRRARLVLSADELDELHAEGMAILHKLAVGYRPHIKGHAQEGRFSGYAAVYLSRKLGDAWHAMHPEHLHVTREDGKRRWHYGERPVSLEAMTAEDPDRHAIMASSPARDDLEGRLHAALLARFRVERDWIVKVAVRIGRGEQPAHVATELGLDEDSVRRHMRTITRALPSPTHIFRKTSELRAALDQLAEQDAKNSARVGGLLSQGATVADIAQIMEVETNQVRDHEDAIRRVWHQIESEGE